MDRSEIINSLIKKFKYKTYLELGVQHKVNYDKIKCELKESIDVDRHSNPTYCEPTDSFFERESKDKKYDLIFIDASHYWKHALHDAINSFDILNENGTIVMHDCIPPDEIAGSLPRKTALWCGDVWKAWNILHEYNADLIEMFVIDIDCGVGIIRKKEDLYLDYNIDTNNINDYSFDTFKDFMNIKTVNEFKQWLKK